MKAIVFATLLGVLSCAPVAGADDRRHGHYYDDDRISYSLGLNFGYPPPYYAPAYGFYRGYGPYRRPYGGNFGIGSRHGYYDAFGLFFSFPLYFGPRYEPVPPAPTVLVPSVARTTRANSGDCLQQREYQTEITIDGRKVPAYGTACLKADGSWQIVNGPYVSE